MSRAHLAETVLATLRQSMELTIAVASVEREGLRVPRFHPQADGAQPVAGMANLHGKKGKAMIHIGAVDAPVTIAEIDAAVDECAKLKQGELHVLGCPS